SANVVPFRPAIVEPKSVPSLTPIERRAFRELAQELTSRLRGAPVETRTQELRAQELRLQELAASQNQALSRDELRQVLNQALNQENREDYGEQSGNPSQQGDEAGSDGNLTQNEERGETASEPADEAAGKPAPETFSPPVEHWLEPAFLDRIPLGILVYRPDGLVYANRRFLDLTGYGDVAALEAAGGLNRLFAEPASGAAFADAPEAQTLAIITQSGERLAVEGRLVAASWHASPAMALILNKRQSAGPIEVASNANGEGIPGAEPDAERIAA